MSKPFDLSSCLLARMALLAVTRSSLRNQGAAGMVAVARKYVARLDLAEFSVMTQVDFERALNAHTHSQMQRFPGKGKGNWGAARKTMNIFLRDVLYCHPLTTFFRLSQLEPWLELPLDSYCYAGLKSDHDGSKRLPFWRGVKRLTPGFSDELQTIASDIARKLNTERVHLDFKYWRKKEVDALSG